MRTLLALLVFTSPVFADILVLKDGNILEVKVLEMRKNKDKRDVFWVSNEQGEKFEVPVKDVVGRKPDKPSWEKRADNLKWYEGEKAKPRAAWDAEEKLAKECRKRDLDSQAADHFRKAYDLRKPSIKDEEADHQRTADWLEKTCELFDEALDEMRAVLSYKRKKLAEKDSASGHVGLARFCEGEGLLKEAEEEYLAAQKLDEKSSDAKNGLAKLRLAQEFPLGPAFYRSVRGQMRAAAKFLRSTQNPDGTFGADAHVYNVHGHRAMSCLSAIALMCVWEFDMLEKGDAARDVPKEIATVLDLVVEGKHPRYPTPLQSSDIWGAMFEIDLLARASRKKALSRWHERIRKRMPEVVKELDGYKKGDGGWMYYTFVQTSASFPTGCAILCLLNAKNSGFEIDGGMISKAASTLAGLKFGDGTYNYYEEGGLKGMHPSNSPVGASARSPLCEGALIATGQGKDTSLKLAIDNFFRYRGALAAIKGDGGTHIGKGMVAPYYFLFGHYHTTRVIKLLDRSIQRAYLNEMRKWMGTYQEPDGSFWDWKGEQVPSKVYGTALAIMTLYHIASTERDPGLGQQKIEGPKTAPSTATDK
jgi:hypothetical protein